MEISKKTWWIIGGISVVGLGIGAYFLFREEPDPDADRFGNRAIKDKEKTGGLEGGVESNQTGAGVAVVEPDWDNPYNKSYWKDVKEWLAPKSIKLIPYKEAQKLAVKLKKAYGGAWYYDDNEEMVNNLFKNEVADKVAVSEVAYAFHHTYKKDMYDFLATFLDGSELEKYVKQHVRSLPNYRKA